MSRAAAPQRLKETYTTEARRLASRSMTGLAQTRLTPTALTAAGVCLCVAGGVLVHFQYRSQLLFFWLGAAVFLLGSLLDILDGALARAGGKATPFGAFIDSTTDRIGEAFMLGSIGLVFERQGNDVALAFAFAAVAGSFLVSYTRARAEALSLRGDVGIGSRAERVVVITGGLVLAPWGGLPWAIYLLAATAWLTVVQRIWSVRAQLRRDGAR
ncbi:MAG TPA: CDP-alcohol phosphatidyltransferase family protein [Gaiellaceae bacterium]|nr:CDP-alcohol phosphatidyltransferase family protein [Gaiellaceae bacterium]